MVKYLFTMILKTLLNQMTALFSTFCYSDISFSIALYLACIFRSLFIASEKKGAILTYFQTPFRLLTLLPPSIFFITWPLKYIFGNPKVPSALITVVVFMLFSEILKLSTVISWHKNTIFA